MANCARHGCVRYVAKDGLFCSRTCLDGRSQVATAVKPANEFETTRDFIRRNKKLFIEVGEALIRMHDKKLYLMGGFATFEDYCADEGLSRRQAYREMDATRVRNVSIGHTDMPEAQTRELSPLLKAQGKRAVREVIKEVGKKPTAKKMRKAVQQRLGSGEVEQACTHPRHKCADCGKMLDGD